MYKFFAILILFLSLLQSSLCLTITVKRNGAAGGDEIENKGCDQRICQKYSLFCATRDCCRCGCPNERPNYVVGKGLCKSNKQLKQELKSDCKFDFARPLKPLLDLPLTQANNGSQDFYKDPSDPSLLEVLCNDTIKVGKWYHLDAFGKWQNGNQDIFSVVYHPIQIGHIRNDYILQALEWSSRLKPKYAGALIKISLMCDSKYIGCALAKVMGSKTYDTSNVPTPATQVPPPPTTEPKLISTESPTTTKNESQVYQRVDNNNQNQSKNNTEPALAPTLAVVGLLILALGIAAFIFYRRRQKRRDPEARAFANPDYNEPVYAEVNRDSMDNPVYSDPAAIDAGNRRSILGPLPCIPRTESTYQPLDSETRKYKGDEEIDYDNPIAETPPGADYDNPPIKVENKASSDYENPPVQGAQERNSDYDNPPPVEGEDSEKNEYQVPKSDVAENQEEENTAF